VAGGLRAAAPAPAAAPAAAPGQMVQCTVTVVQNEIVPRDTPCVVAARDVPELGLRLRERCAPLSGGRTPPVSLRSPSESAWCCVRQVASADGSDGDGLGRGFWGVGAARTA